MWPAYKERKNAIDFGSCRPKFTVTENRNSISVAYLKLPVFGVNI